ncbi:MAG: S-layer homology domain-containing protein [Eubacteriales bacterium]|nr:S-layer homology domain-containing protein [Eubacteriales bacterium]
MKMRKALSFVLVLALVLGSFSMAFAADPVKQGSDLSDISGNANYDAIVANSDLGIITGYEDGSFKPVNNVNRAEFAAMITRMMGVPASALGGYSASAFSDMNNYGWANSYVGFCSAKGIVNGYGDGTFGPGNTITVNEAITMVLRSIGYVNNSDELVGAWPSNYVTLGKRLGLYDDVTSVATIDRANAAQVIYNALTLETAAVDSEGKTTLSGDAVLEVYLDCKLVGNPSVDNGFDVYTNNDANGSVINTMEYVGAYVKAFENSDGDVVAIAEVKSTFLTGKYNATGKTFKAAGVKYNLAGDGTNATVNFKSDGPNSPLKAAVFTNGEDISLPVAGSGAMAADTTYTIAANVSGKTIKEVYSVIEWAAADTFQFEAEMLDDESLNGYDFALDDNDKIDADRFVLLGVDSLDKIAEDNVVKVYLAKKADTTSDIVKVAVGTEKVEGKVTLIDSDDYTIGGKVYAANTSDPIALGDTGTAYLDYDGDIAFWDVEDAASENYAIVTGAYIASSPTVRDATIVLFDKEGNEKEYTIKTGTTLPAAGEMLVDQVVTFSLNKDGKIDKLNAVNEIPLATADKLSDSRTVLNNDRVDAGIVVFAKDASDYSVISINDVETKEDLTKAGAVTGFKVVDGKVKVLIVDSYFTGQDSVYAVLNFVKAAYNNDDDEVQLVKGLAAGKAYEAYTDAKNTLTATDFVNANGALNTIVIAELGADSNGIITRGDIATITTKEVGKYVVEKSGRDLGISDSSAANADVDRYAPIDSDAVVYVYDDVDKEYSLGTWASIKAQTANGAGSKVYLYQVDDDSEVYDIVVVYGDAATATANMNLALTTPVPAAGNTIAVGGATKAGDVNVVNTTTSVVITGTKTAAQTVTIGGANAADVTATGTATAPIYTVDTTGVAAAGGNKTFTLTVSEAGKADLVYTVTVVVAAP